MLTYFGPRESWYLQGLLWIHSIKRDAIHRKVMDTVHRVINEDDVDFQEAAESAVNKQKFLLNKVMHKKMLADKSDEAEEEMEASV